MPPAHMVQLSINANGLKSRMFTSCNLFAMAYIINPKSEDEEYIGRTEIIENTTNPQWIKVFNIAYHLGRELCIKVSIYHCKTKQSEKVNLRNSSKNIYLGSEQFDIIDILGRKCKSDKKELTHGGSLMVRLEKSKYFKKPMSLRLQLRGINFDNTQKVTFLSIRSMEVSFQLSRNIVLQNGSEWVPVYRSEFVDNYNHPMWKPIDIDLEKLCNHNLRRWICVKVIVRRKNGKQISLGCFEAPVEHIIASKATGGNGDLEKAYTLKKNNVNVGQIIILEAKIIEIPNENAVDICKPTFYDYLYGGCEMKLSVAIDFSSNNFGDVSSERSPHFNTLDTTTMNDYENAIYIIGTILANYDSDQYFPVRGFGIMEGNTELQLFQCGLTNEVRGVGGILNAYRSMLQCEYEACSKSSLSEIINWASKNSRSNSENSLSYSILLILTAGKINDLEKTKIVLSNAISSPLSVVIVGIGNENFDDMRSLDKEIVGFRDIVKFVELNNHVNMKETLSESVLEKIPSQVVDYFWNANILPNEPYICER